MALSADALLMGGSATHVVTIPPHMLSPSGGEVQPGSVVVRPLRLVDVQRVQRAAQDQQALTSVLIVQQALVEPALTVEQVTRMHAGLVQYLLREINRLSGLSLDADELESTVQAPLSRACYVLAREFGWSPEDCAGLTLGQILVYLEMIGRDRPRLEQPV